MTGPAVDRVPTRQECLQALAQVLVDAAAYNATRTPRQVAVAAWYPGHRLSVDGIEDLVREQRGLPALDRAGAA